jgi:hypothetical protein
MVKMVQHGRITTGEGFVGNPNNCQTCDHKCNPQGGWCYMFRDEPKDICYQHTFRTNGSKEIAFLLKALNTNGSKY